MPVEPGLMVVHGYDDFFAAIASGSFPSDAMVVCPCSSGSLGCIVSGVNRHLVHRAAEVHLKERRPLILVVRETPLSLIQLENMVAITKSGGTVLPAAPHFYGVSEPHQPLGVADLIDSIAARILDRLHIEHPIQNRWKEGS